MSVLPELTGLTGLSGLAGPAAYGALAAAVLTESVLLVGAFVPTLALMLSAGALARAGELHLGLVIGVAAVAVVCGDALGHATGRALGPRLRHGRLGARIPDGAWGRAAALMEARGGAAVLVCRFLPVLRTLAPHLAGATGLPYRRLAPYSAAGALVWAGAEAGAGYAAATSVERLAAVCGPVAPAVVGGAVVLGAVLGGRLRRRRGAGQREASGSCPSTVRT